MKTLRFLPALFLGAALTGCPTAPKPDPIPPSPKVVAFTATPAQVTPGGEVTLAWEVTDATKVTITDLDKGAVSGVDDALTGTVRLVPTASTLYVLDARNDRGAKATAFVSVTVAGADAEKLLFAAYPEVIAPGDTGTLVWSAPGAKNVTITPMGGAALDLMGQVQSGTISVDPTDTETTYTLNADGQTRTVTVTRGVAITELTLSQPVAQPDDMVTVSWKTAHATKVTLSSPGLGMLFESTTAAEVAMGSFAQAVPTLPTGTVLNYVLDSEGPGGSARRTVSLVIGTDPVVTEVTAPRYAKTGGTFTLAWKAANADAVEVRVGTLTIYRTTDFSQVATGSVLLPTPALNTTYTVAAVALPSGLSATKDATVDPVGDVTVSTFTATPTTVANGGDAVTLTWNVPNARQLRILQDDELTVVWKEGATAGTGTATVYPNRPTARFSLSATNTIDGAQTATADVTVGAVAELTSFDGGVIFEGAGNIELGFPVGTEVVGLPADAPVFNGTSTGFDDISMTGEALTYSSGDNATVQFAVPGWETFLYGQRLGATSNVSVCTNGWLALRATTLTTSAPPTTFPGTSTSYDNFLAPFWANLELGPNGVVYWQVKGEAPNRTLIVQWNRVRLVGEPMSSLTFQAKVTQAGDITFEYQALDNLPATYTSASGLQGTGGRGLVGSPAAGASLRFFGPQAAPAVVSGASLPVSGFVKIGTGLTRMTLGRFVRAGDFTISEVMYAPAATVTAGEWLEVRNGSTSPIDLSGWEIDFGGGNVHTIASSVPVAPGGLVVLGQTADPMLNDGVTVNYAYGAAFTMNDMAGSITLRAGVSNISVSWTATGPGAAGAAALFDPTPIITSATTSTLGPRPCTATQPYGSQVPQQFGTPGTVGSCRGYLLERITGAFEDVSSTGTAVTMTGVSSFDPEDEGLGPIDVSSAPITLFGGMPTSTLTAVSNGWLYPYAYSGTSAGLSNKTRPSTSSPASGLIISPFWDDLEWTGRAGAGIFYKRHAAMQSAVDPRAHWIVQWKNLSHYSITSNNDDMNFEVKFFDDGDVEFHYGTMSSGSTSNYANGNNATVWMENPAGTEALTFSINQPNITSNMGLRFKRTP